MSIPIRPRNSEDGNPFWTRAHVFPASVVFHTPLSLNPGSFFGSDHLRRMRCHVVAYSTFGSVGSITRSLAPVIGLTYSTLSQVRPPLVDLKTPRISLGVHSCPLAAT